MFILLKSGAMLNLYWLQDCFQGKHEKNIVIFYMVNGSKIIEEYDTETEAKDRVDEVHFMMDEASLGDTKPLIVDELPTENISTRRTYLLAVSDDPEDGYQEWRYIEQQDGTYKWEMQGISKDYSYSKEDIDEMKDALEETDVALQDNIDQVDGQLTAERSARINADTNLQEQINTINGILDWQEY